MTISYATFDSTTGPPKTWDDEIFSYCEFDGLSVEGPFITGAVLWSAFRKVDWYWGMVNTAVIAKTTFEDCTFRGSSFMSGLFTACEFKSCRFVLDNLGGAVSFDGCVFSACIFENCEIIPDPRNRRLVSTNTRWLGCRAANCKGFEGMI